MEKTGNDLIGKIDDAIEKGIDYLYEHQFPNGEFCCYYAPDDEMQEWCVPDSTVFPSALIACCLLKIKDLPKVKKILGLTTGFLQYQMMRGGVWSYYTKWNPLFKYSPADLDDTAIVSYALRDLGINFPDNSKIFSGSRNSKGLFYTWIVLRPSLNKDLNYWKVTGRELKRPIDSLAFWSRHEVKRNDVDAIVNANILFYLGLNEITKPIINYLIEIINNNDEETTDKWYKNPFAFYYFVSRNYLTIKELEPVRDKIISKIYKLKNTDGGFGNNAFENALAISTLINLKHIDLHLEKAVCTLLNMQSKSGYWKRHIFYYSGPSKVVGWGSEEIITAHCIEALVSYRNATLI
ncbi:hypothetical protein ACFOG5_07045 [Pedobacter fastidiosus]|uniref:Prenyltransferase and squalene oxidase repeat-containing protein n=1 Tax=Pedobacter fastidiosus TaxID=2765361 RepID=A0ABR7KW06_9SPHI|nr:hypothetical protein [Pedobacter fastidiosus]MBC6112104.1 hypothetical protein [Pedobacter fastidiosus]